MAVLVVVAGVFLFSETAGTTFGADEWVWALQRRGNSPGTFLESYNGHFSLVPLAIYRLLFATAGLRSYVPYRALVLIAHLGCGVLVFLYARHRVESFLAVLAAALILFLGPGWEDILWPFQAAWLISIGTGVAALLMLDRRDLRGDAAACLLLACSLASSGIGPPIALGAAVDVLGGPNRWRRAWVVAAPLAAYGLWWLAYQHGAIFVQQAIFLVPGFVVGLGAATIGGLSGLAGQMVSSAPGTLLTFGAPLAALGVAAMVWRLIRLGRIPLRVMTLFAVMLLFAILLALQRDVVAGSYSSSRYLYVGSVFVVLLAVELARGIQLSSRARLVAAILVAIAALSNVSVFRDAAGYLRNQAQLTTADLGALAIARPIVRPDYVAGHFPGWPFVIVQAGPYFAAEKALGSPAATPSELEADPEAARALADSELLTIHGIALQASLASAVVGMQPVVDLVLGGTVRSRGACIEFTPSSVAPPGADNELQLTIPPGGLRISAEGESASIAVRRFATQFEPVGTVARSASTTVRIGPDSSAVQWHARVTASGGATICGLR